MKEEKIESPFVLRSYTKMELAHLYLPQYSQRVALRKFNRWMRTSPVLWSRLQASGLTVYSRVYGLAQVKLIIGYLGAP